MDTQLIVKTKFFGEVRCTENERLSFPEGIPGFEAFRSFALLDLPQVRPLLFLQSLDRQDLCFAALPAQQVKPGYRVQLSPPDWKALALSADHEYLPAREFLSLALVSLDDAQPSANLLAPVVIHVPSRRGVQAIQWNTDYPPRAPLSPLTRTA